MDNTPQDERDRLGAPGAQSEDERLPEHDKEILPRNAEGLASAVVSEAAVAPHSGRGAEAALASRPTPSLSLVISQPSGTKAPAVAEASPAVASRETEPA